MTVMTPAQLKKKLPLPITEKRFIDQSRQEIQQLINREDERLAIVMGPCSIHHIDSALEYAEKLKTLYKEVKKNCLLVMRVYAEKPRTRIGWKGLLYDPHLDGSNDISYGIYATRKLLLALAKMEIPTATEFVDPLAYLYFNDLVSWGFIGARTSASQPHRQIASSLPMPIGFKNATNGDIDTAINGVIAASHPHSFLSMNEQGMIAIQTSQGNPSTHIVLRGSEERPNYDLYSVQSTLTKLKNQGLSPRLMIDCAHGNCNKEYGAQKEVFKELIERISHGEHSLFGLMLESHLEAGNRLSLTDPCIDWATTEELVLFAHTQVTKLPLQLTLCTQGA